MCVRQRRTAPVGRAVPFRVYLARLMEFSELVSIALEGQLGRATVQRSLLSWLRMQPKGCCLKAFEGSAGQLKYLRDHVASKSTGQGDQCDGLMPDGSTC